MNNIFWITGNCGAGKTTLAKAVRANLPLSIMLDGDAMRTTISAGLSFSKEDRMENNRRIASLAALLASQGHLVVVSVIAPYEDLRSMVDAACRPYWVFAHRKAAHDFDCPYEIPAAPHLVIDNDALSPNEAARTLLAFIRDAKFDEPWTHGVSFLNHNNA
jgi:adenylylsulfate kinase-like enzyme